MRWLIIVFMLFATSQTLADSDDFTLFGIRPGLSMEEVVEIYGGQKSTADSYVLTHVPNPLEGIDQYVATVGDEVGVCGIRAYRLNFPAEGVFDLKQKTVIELTLAYGAPESGITELVWEGKGRNPLTENIHSIIYSVFELTPGQFMIVLDYRFANYPQCSERIAARTERVFASASVGLVAHMILYKHTMDIIRDFQSEYKELWQAGIDDFVCRDNLSQENRDRFLNLGHEFMVRLESRIPPDEDAQAYEYLTKAVRERSITFYTAAIMAYIIGLKDTLTVMADEEAVQNIRNDCSE